MDSYADQSGGYIYVVDSIQIPCIHIADARFINGNSFARWGILATCGLFATNTSFSRE